MDKRKEKEMEVGDKIRIKFNLLHEMKRLEFDDDIINSFCTKYSGTIQKILAIWSDGDQEYVTIDLCCEVPIQCIEVV